jgi:hypothetical protein
MPDLTGFPALDVAIGLAFLFLLLSTLCSAVNEAIAATLGWRAKTLEDGIGRVLGDPKRQKSFWTWLRSLVGLVDKPPEDNDKGAPPEDNAKDNPPDDNDKSADPLGHLAPRVMRHWSIASLVRDPKARSRRRARPSYLPPDVVSLAVAQVVAAGADAKATEASLADPGDSDSLWARSDENAFKAINDALGEIPLEGPRGVLVEAATKAEATIDSFRRDVEAAFNDAMERASGWYKRKAQFVILVLALAITVAMNVNTITVATRLWNDESLRSAVTSAAVTATTTTATAGGNGSTASGSGGAVAIAQSGSSASSPSKPAQQPAPGDKCAPAANGASGPAADAAACAKQRAQAVRDALTSIDQLDLPLGWEKANKPKFPGVLLGWLITIAALTFGAPFWFDALNRLVRLRSSGVPAAPDTSGAVGQPGAATTNSSAVPQELQRPRRE